ncbi:MAG: PDZ domain-containing protein [Sphingobacteriales bacterium]|nr:MAG: PDZ domain-containing protein [Sphingobacteriales bacterium]
MKSIFRYFLIWIFLIISVLLTFRGTAFSQNSDSQIRVKIKSNINGQETIIDTVLNNSNEYQDLFQEFSIPDVQEAPDRYSDEFPLDEQGKFADKSHQRSQRYNKNDRSNKQAVSKNAALGVIISSDETDDDEEGVKIQTVIQGSAAESAGLQASDLILTINEKELYSAQELIEEVGNFSPGDMITIEYMRNSNRKTTTAILQEAENKQAYTPHQPDMNMDDFFNQDFWKDNPGMNDFQQQMEELMRKMEEMFSQIQPQEGEMQEQWKDFNPNQYEDYNDNNSAYPKNEVNTLKVDNLSLAFNPSDKQIEIYFSLENKSPIVVKLYDSKGNKIFEEEVNNFKGNFSKTISVGKASFSENFILKINQDGKTYNKKIETK